MQIRWVSVLASWLCLSKRYSNSARYVICDNVIDKVGVFLQPFLFLFVNHFVSRSLQEQWHPSLCFSQSKVQKLYGPFAKV